MRRRNGLQARVRRDLLWRTIGEGRKSRRLSEECGESRQAPSLACLSGGSRKDHRFQSDCSWVTLVIWEGEQSRWIPVMRNEVEEVLANWISQATSGPGKLPENVNPAAWVAQ